MNSPPALPVGSRLLPIAFVTRAGHAACGGRSGPSSPVGYWWNLSPSEARCADDPVPVLFLFSGSSLRLSARPAYVRAHRGILGLLPLSISSYGAVVWTLIGGSCALTIWMISGAAS